VFGFLRIVLSFVVCVPFFTWGLWCIQVLNASPDVLACQTGRTELLEWIGKHVDRVVSSDSPSLPPACLSGLCPTVVACLLSKDHTSRAASQKLIGSVGNALRCGRVPPPSPMSSAWLYPADTSLPSWGS
jgi:hypothetical protein